MEQQHLTADPAQEGRKAFRTHGVTGQYMHTYPAKSVERIQFLGGFSDERHRAAERALNDAHAYYDLTVREAATDRAWAEKLSARAQ